MPTEIQCPKCGSVQITAMKQGFGLGKAALGGALLGPVGLLGGMIGSGKVNVVCLKCGHKWDPASLRIQERQQRNAEILRAKGAKKDKADRLREFEQRLAKRIAAKKEKAARIKVEESE